MRMSLFLCKAAVAATAGVLVKPIDAVILVLVYSHERNL